ncbi:MAG: hypothetical protein JG776_390 [Caloramator sp.]|jgi:ATP-dependent helicase/nuclease subunit A|uniref:UvrD-helicase domain-containing protein n=1 Tax=Caloramator sp. TaxID=1871330 RepID=UPI001D23D044|nr:UvrD-helicase domain-containing protein [Caloramator sp.]MBZ4662708.1 hypothetical protein [Caloramator sp.]
MNIEEIKNVYGVNDEQARALDINKNIALHAGAGSGKTRVLTRRFLRLLIEGGADVDDIVAITFTKKAALEMKERVIDLVNKFIEQEKDRKKRDALRKIKEELPLANISTFHSFCDTLVKENYYIVGIEPMYKIVEEVDTLTLLNRIADEVLDEFVNNSEYRDKFETVAEVLGVEYLSKKKIIEDVKHLYKEIKTKGDSIEEAKRFTENNIKRFNELTPKEEKKRGRKSNNTDEGDLEKLQIIINLVMDLVDSVDKKYSEEKKKLGVLDFNDLEKYTLQILEVEEVRNRIKERYKYYLVDEFQDTNDVQLKILSYLTEEENKIKDGKLFVVGDIKQSIYLFRGANYKVFEDVTDKIKNSGGEKLNLSTNYRSHDKIVDIINNMFENLMDAYEPSKVSNGVKGEAGFDFCILETEEKTNFDTKQLKERRVELDELKVFLEKEDKDEKRRNEAEYVADKILELKEKGIEYKDIAILFRGRSGVLEFENSLKKRQIPYTILGGIGYFERQEIRDLINIVRFIYRYEDKLSLLGILRSPFVGLSDNEVLDVYNIINENKYISSAQNYNDKVKRLFELKEEAPLYSVSSFLKKLDKELKIKDILLLQEDGVQKYRNFEKFLEIAEEFDRKGIYSSIEFVDYLENLIEISQKEGQAFLDTENSNAVKIMTIHASKGLEFEAVFIPSLDYEIAKSNKKKFVYDKFGNENARYGIVINHDAIKKDGLYKYVEEKRKEEEKKEEIRIFYVGVTRAIRYLSLSAVRKKRESTLINYLVDCGINFERYVEETSTFKDYKKEKEENNYEEDIFDIDRALENINININYIPKSIFSISRYMLYKDCPRKYFFRYIAKIDEGLLDIDFLNKKEDEEEQNEAEIVKNINAAEIGSFVHSILEDVSKGYKVDIEDRINRELYEISNEQKEKIKTMVQNYEKIEKSIKINGEKLFSHQEFNFRVPLPNTDIILMGIIDRLDIYQIGDTKKAVVIDYKTNKVNSEEDKERLKNHYLPQFIAYRFAVEKIYDIEIEKMYLYLLDTGEYIEMDIKNEEIQKGIKDIVEVFNFMETNKELNHYDRCENCYLCNYKFICE